MCDFAGNLLLEGIDQPVICGESRRLPRASLIDKGTGGGDTLAALILCFFSSF